ncbi:MAG: amidohydrolase family protein [Actinoallomurus sp.]
MFDGTTASGPATVLIDGGKIAAVESGSAPIPMGARVVDLGPDSFLMPGLIDAHVHLAFDAGPDAVTALIEADDATLLTRMRGAAARALRAGITTLRDLGDRNYLGLTLAAELTRPGAGPEIIAAGPPITTPGGHCYFMGGEAEGAEALRAAVRERHERGCGVVKIMASGGNMTPGSLPQDSQFSLDDLRVVVKEANRLGLPVAAHTHGVQAIRDAVTAGVNTLEHVSFWTAEAVHADPALLAAIADSDVVVSMTLGEAPVNGRVMEPRPAVAKRLPQIKGASRRLHELGATMVVGSDAGIAPFKPHDVLPYGVVQLTDLGFSPLEALASATSVAARACGVEDRKGRIGVGADADMLAITGDPLQDLNRLRHVRAVFRAGIQVR